MAVFPGQPGLVSSTQRFLPPTVLEENISTLLWSTNCIIQFGLLYSWQQIINLPPPLHRGAK